MENSRTKVETQKTPHFEELVNAINQNIVGVDSSLGGIKYRIDKLTGTLPENPSPESKNVPREECLVSKLLEINERLEVLKKFAITQEERLSGLI